MGFVQGKRDCNFGGTSAKTTLFVVNPRNLLRVRGPMAATPAPLQRDTLAMRWPPSQNAYFIDLLMGLFRGAVFHHGGVPENC